MKLVLIWIVLSLFLLTSIVAVYAQSDGTGKVDKTDNSTKNTAGNATGTTEAENNEKGKKTANPNPTLLLEPYGELKVNENGNQSIKESAVISNPTHLPFTFIVTKNSTHGTITIMGSTLKYTPSPNYNGSDRFTIKASAINTTSATTKPILSNQQIVNVVIEPKPLFNAPPVTRAALAFGLSSVVVILIFFFSFLIIRKTGKFEKPPPIARTKFRDILRDENWYPSLAIFQFLMWTAIVLFAYFGIALLRFFSGVGPFTDINQNILIVMGISAGTTVGATYISNRKYGMAVPAIIESTRDIPTDEDRKNLPEYKTMLMENDKITLTRFQMFAWTWIGVIAYLGLLFMVISTQLDYIKLISLPTLPAVFPILMGISQGAYLSDKLFRQKYISINEVRPKNLRLNQTGNTITIFGSNLLKKVKKDNNGQEEIEPGTVWLEYYPPLPGDNPPTPVHTGAPPLVSTPDPLKNKSLDKSRYDPDRMEKQFDVTPEEAGSWTASTIRVNLDKVKEDDLLDTTMGKGKPARYVVRVERSGLLTYAHYAATVMIYPTTTATATPTTTATTTTTSSKIQKKGT